MKLRATNLFRSLLVVVALGVSSQTIAQYAFVRQAEFSENRGTASAATVSTAAFGANLTAGNLLVAYVAYVANPDTGARTVTLSGASSPTWNCETTFTDGAGDYVHACYAMNIPGGVTTALTATFSGTDSGFVEFPAIYAAEYSGLKTSAARLAFIPSNQATPTTGTDATTSGLLGTLSAQPAAIIAMSFNAAGNSAPTAGTSFTSRTSVWTYQGATAVVMRPEDRRVTATTSVAGTFTATSNTQHQTLAWAFEEASGSPATLSSATPSGTLGTSTVATLGATTNVTSGTFYGVVDPAGQISGITAAQVKAAQDNAGGAVTASCNASVSTTTPSCAVSGLTASTLYSYAVVQNSTGGDSNVLTGTFTTAAAASVVINPISGGGGAAARPVTFNQVEAANDDEFRLRASR